MAVGTPALVGGQHVVIRPEMSPHASAVLFVSHTWQRRGAEGPQALSMSQPSATDHVLHCTTATNVSHTDTTTTFSYILHKAGSKHTPGPKALSVLHCPGAGVDYCITPPSSESFGQCMPCSWCLQCLQLQYYWLVASGVRQAVCMS
jgi:hypothetical protein